ncbi:MAG: SPOR domain-containing protein [Hyphomicrobiales bacterium]
MPAPKPASAPAPAPAAKPAVAVAQDSLAERLKAQRQAAEKLAEQRVSMAREKAEARAVDSAATRKEEPRPAPAPASEKPKFTFADEEIAAAKRETPMSGGKEFQAGLLRKAPPPPPPPINGPSVTPPRPTLGGEKPIAGTGAGEPRRMQPQLGASTQPSLGYRPLDPPSFQSALKRGTGIQAPQRGFNAPRPSFGDNGFGDQRRREQPEDYRRRPEPNLRGEDRDMLRAEPRRAPARGRRQDYDDEMGDVFEDEAPPQRRRANARDYNQAYQEYDENDRDEAPRRRSSGPLLILLAILVVAGLFVTGLWYYYFHMKPVAVTSGGAVPVITAPDGPAKVNPEPNAETTGTDLAPASTAKKKIYDRILGEADTGGQMVPTEEQPSPVEPLPTPQPDNSGMLPEPVAPSGQTGLNNETSASPIPEPAGGQASGESMPTPEPLPLPPTPGNDGTQGSMPMPDTNTLAAEVQNATRGTNATALSAAPEPPAPEPPAAAASGGESLAMAEASSNDGAATNEQATPPSDDEPAAAAPEPDEVQPPKAKSKQKTATSTSKKQKTAAAESAASGQPLVLVAPSEPPPPPAAVESVVPSTENVAATATDTTTNSGSLFGSGAKKLTGKRAENAGSTAKTISSSQQASASTQDQVASIDTQQRTTSSSLQPEPAPAPKASTSTTTTTSSGGTGYVAQVASLRSEAEARAELDRLRGSYGNLIGSLSTRITKATVAGTTRYRLGFGPLPSRSEAAKLCSSLIAAGERDCAVRGL